MGRIAIETIEQLKKQQQSGKENKTDFRRTIRIRSSIGRLNNAVATEIANELIFPLSCEASNN